MQHVERCEINALAVISLLESCGYATVVAQFATVWGIAISTSTSVKLTTSPNQYLTSRLVQVARLPGFRALAWSGDMLYASSRYELLRTRVQDSAQKISWEFVAKFRPGWKRKLSVANNLSARLFRDGFHALAVLPSGGLVAGVAGFILTANPNSTDFSRTHVITRGTRPLHITAVPGGAIFWGEYFDNPSRDEVHIYGSTDAGATWNVAYTFPKGAIRHVHNIVHDPFANCLWVLTGDNGDECRILRATCDFRRVEPVMQGRQQARAVAAIPTEEGLYFSSDTPLEPNFIYRLDHEGKLFQLAAISSSSIYGCRTGNHLFFSTMVEPSEVNRDLAVRLYGANLDRTEVWEPLLSWQKDRWPMSFFQYGNALLPDGINATPYLAVTTVAVQQDDMVTSVFSINP